MTDAASHLPAGIPGELEPGGDRREVTTPNHVSSGFHNTCVGSLMAVTTIGYLCSIDYLAVKDLSPAVLILGVFAPLILAASLIVFSISEAFRSRVVVPLHQRTVRRPAPVDTYYQALAGRPYPTEHGRPHAVAVDLAENGDVLLRLISADPEFGRSTVDRTSVTVQQTLRVPYGTPDEDLARAVQFMQDRASDTELRTHVQHACSVEPAGLPSELDDLTDETYRRAQTMLSIGAGLQRGSTE
jgi:hypothetical protein